MPTTNRRPLYDAEGDGVSGAEPARPAAEAAPPGALAVGQGDRTGAVASAPPFKTPCTFKGAASAVYAGALGYFLGFVPAAIRLKGRQWGLIHSQGVGSAGQLALMSGMYTAVHCICQRIRLVEDGWNRGIAGCSTGLVLGWPNGPWSALQSCVGLGAISALIDLGGGAVEAAEAAALQQLSAAQAGAQHLTEQQPGPCLPWALPRQAHLGPLQPALTAVQQLAAASPLMFLGACCQADAASGAASGAAAGVAARGGGVDACELRRAGGAMAEQQRSPRSRGSGRRRRSARSE